MPRNRNLKPTLFRNALIVTGDPARPLIKDGAILIEGGSITAVGSTRSVGQPSGVSEILDAGGKVVMPGFINAHTHLYGAFARGLPTPAGPPRTFRQILEQIWWRLDRALGSDDVYISALLGLAEAIRSGVTTIFDHHSSPTFVDGSLDLIATAVKTSGIRACLCYEVSDRNGKTAARQGIEENGRFLRSLRGTESEWIAASFGLHASFTLSEDTLRRSVREAHNAGSGFHVHVAEDKADLDDAHRRYGSSVVERLARTRVLGPTTIAAHCVHVSASDLTLLGSTETLVVHNPRSNMNNAVGCAPVVRMLARGITVGLGTDGFSPSIMEELRTLPLAHRLTGEDPRLLAPPQAVAIAITNNGRIAGKYFPRPLGVIRPGAGADLIVLDYNPPTPFDRRTLADHLYWGISASPVSLTMVGGKVLMRDRRLLTLDVPEILRRSQQLARRVWRRLG